MRWSPWPSLFAVKFDVVLVVHRIEGVYFVDDRELTTRKRPVVEILWRGSKTVTLKRSGDRSFTEEGGFRSDGVVEWNEEFKRVCEFSVLKEGVFVPWLVSFTVFNGMNKGSKKVRSFGKASLNIAEYFSLMKEDNVQVKVPLKISGSSSSSTQNPCLHISLQFSSKESLPESQRSALPVLWSPLSAEADKAESVVKVGLRKMKTFNHCMSNPQASDEESSKNDGSSGSGNASLKSQERNLDSESTYPSDTDVSLDEDNAADESEENKEDPSGMADPVSYETLRYANWARGSLHADTNPEDDDLIYFSHRSPLADTGHCGDNVSNDTVGSEHVNGKLPKKKMLSWKKRKLSFRSPKQKGEPLLKKDCLEEGGDDIDFDRRQLSSSDESTSDDTIMKPLSEFGDDDFVVGSWETKEIISRDGLMKLTARVFLASIDQRSERAAGESACTALVAVMTHWLGSNRDIIPTRSEFDSLIREGSSEWRNLCENKEYKERFPDKHFDLETVLQAKIRPISIIPEKSFIGFFHPDKSEEEDTSLDFLNGVMSFDNIWEEIIRHEPEESASEPVIYIVSWNDHFFVLLVDHDAYYIIDTLGERLYEGCNQAYILKFDKDTEIQRLEPGKDKNTEQAERSTESGQEVLVSRGKESCREYIKSFLAAIPIQQLKVDMKKGLVSSLHHRLQIEFHYTRHLHDHHHDQPNLFESSANEESVSESAVSVTEAELFKRSV